MKIRYLLKKKDTDFLIYVAIYELDETVLISTGQRIRKGEWSIKDNKPKDHRSTVAKAIEKVKAEVMKSITRLEGTGEDPTPAAVRIEYKKMHGATVEARRQSIVKEKNDLSKVVILAKWWQDNGLFKYRKNTQRAVKSSIQTFIDYLKAHKLSSLEQKALAPAIINAYDRYLLTKKHSDNTHGRLMKHLTWFLHSIGFKTDFIKIRTNPVVKISLTLEELRLLENKDVSERVEWQKAKDCFLIGCYTGLRISDIKRLNPVNTKDGMIQMRLLKTNKEVKIPIIKACDEILKRYNYRSPRFPDQKVNEHIKEVCKEAKINSPVIKPIHRGGEMETKTYKKYKLITSHVAGKTFITLAPKLWGLTPAEIAHIVGKDLRTLLLSYFNDQSESGRQKMMDMDSKLKVS